MAQASASGGDTSQSNGDASQSSDASQSNGDASQSNGDASQSNGDVSQSNGNASQSNGNASLPTGGDASSSKEKGTIFALIIGINDYQCPDDLPRLRGAVNDAREFRRYLLDPYDARGLQVPPANIVLLENEQATRDAILSTFKSHFIDNENIPDHGKAQMIFFFAGHGSRTEATGNHISRDLKVETICPVDERTKNAAGEYVHTIPDYIFGWLLKELAEKKGPNVIAILDSCNSGGALREVKDAGGPIREELTFRTAMTDSARIPPELDSHLWEGKTKTVQSYRLWNMPTASHVLLAACRATEKAQEVDYDGTRRGRFTIELIDRLRWAPHWKTTYQELIDMIPVWDNQTPHCGGGRNTRLVFSGNYPITGLRALLLKPYPEIPENKLNPTNSKSFKSSQSFSVPIGSVEGAVPGTEFYAYDEQNNLLCTLVAQSVKLDHTILTGALDKPEVEIPSGSRVRVSDWKNHPMILKVYTPADFGYAADLFPTATDRPPKFVQTKLEEAHVRVRSDGDEIVIKPLTATMLKCMTEVRFPLHDKPEHLPDVFDGVAHFNYFLERKNVADPLHGFALEMHQLRGNYPMHEPDPSVGKNGNMVVDGAVRFVSDANAIYGFTIRNTSPEELFPYLFYFDPEEYTIDDWYTPENRNAAPLDANDGKVTLGMGGEKAFEFSLPPGKRESSGFLKLFVTREFIDLGWIEQGLSPFDSKFEGTGRLKVQREKLDCISTWDALTVTLTMVSD